jgi:LPXTG-site transpeptidase (sortase) family protein
VARVSADAGARLLGVVGLVAGCLLAVGVAGDGKTVAGTVDAPTAGSTPARHALADAGERDRSRASPRQRPDRDVLVAPFAHAGRPRSVVIPALHVRAPVRGIDPEGRVLVPPSDPTSVGWWREGARPGARHGAAVLTGHTVSTGGGAFDDLDRLRSGDTVRVTTSTATLAFVVDRARTYAKTSLTQHAARLFGQDGPGRLVLVTCSDWDGQAYRSNFVATAALRAVRKSTFGAQD